MGIEYRINMYDLDSVITEEESRSRDYHKITTDDFSREIRIETYEGGLMTSRIDISYEIVDGIKRKIEKYFKQGEFDGHNVSIEDGDIFEMYDKDGKLINLLKGTYDYLIESGKPTRKLYDLLRGN